MVENNKCLLNLKKKKTHRKKHETVLQIFAGADGETRGVPSFVEGEAVLQTF